MKKKNEYSNIIKYKNLKKGKINPRKKFRRSSKSQTILLKIPKYGKEVLYENKIPIYSEIDTENSNFSVPYPTFKKSYLFQNNFENFFSGSENSYSSTYNSSNRTKFISEKNIKNYPLLNYDKSTFRRFQTGIELMKNNKKNYISNENKLKKTNTCISQSMKNIFLNTNYLDKDKKKNINKVTSDNNLINEKKIF
jgi:hypothetical protein